MNPEVEQLKTVIDQLENRKKQLAGEFDKIERERRESIDVLIKHAADYIVANYPEEVWEAIGYQLRSRMKK